MVSTALLTWQGKRSNGLANLESAHSALTTGFRGRQWLTEEINHALIVRLMSELQGFARDLYDESVTVFVNPAVVPAPWLRPLLVTQFRTARALDRGNAGPSNLGSDFGRLGVKLWDELGTAYGVSQRKGWNDAVERLNEARNAIAHNNPDQLAGARATQPLTIKTVRKWRKDLDGLVVGMDNVLGKYLATVSGSHPWP